MIRSIHEYYMGQRPTTGQFHDPQTVKQHLSEINFDEITPAAVWAGTKAMGRAIPLIGALGITHDLYRLGVYVDKKYPSFFRDQYEAIVDARRYYSGDRNKDNYYTDNWDIPIDEEW